MPGFQVNYGNPYDSAVGAATFEHAREETDFARAMANNQVKLQERRLELADAQLVLDGNFRMMQESRARRGEEREELAMFEDAMRWRANHQAQLDADDERRRQFGATDDRLTSQFDVTESRLREQMEQNTKQALRTEQNELRSLGARPIADGNPGKDEYLYRDAEGQIWGVPTVQKQRLDDALTKAQLDQQIRGPQQAQKEMRGRVQSNLSAAIRNAIDLRDQALKQDTELDEEIAEAQAQVDALRKKKNLRPGEQRTLQRHVATVQNGQKRKAGLGVDGLRAEASVLAYYQAIFALAPGIVEVVSPEQLSLVDWGRLTPRDMAGVRVVFEMAANPDPATAARGAVAWRQLRERYPK